MAGNETEGLRYGVIETPEKHWQWWKEAESPVADAGDNPLLRELGHLCGKERLLEIAHDFIVFDAGTKKACASQPVLRRPGGARRTCRTARGRHSSGIRRAAARASSMVWLAKWIRENVQRHARVLIITDRTELDEQIGKVFEGVSEEYPPHEEPEST